MNINTLLQDAAFINYVEKSDPDEFTFYDVLDMAHYEIRHSNTLSWLFNSKSAHKLGNLFLIKFIESLYSYNKNHEKLYSIIKPDNRGIFLIQSNEYIDFNKVKFEIRREWKYIDLLIISEEIKFLITIENKPGMEDPGQLSSYKNNVIDTEFPEDKYTRIFVFLTIDGSLPEKEDDKYFWLPFDYKEIVKIIDKYILSPESIKVINDNRIEDFIRQYNYNLKKNSINYFDQTNDASILYNKHKSIFNDLIEFKNRNELNNIFAEHNLDKKIQDSINYILLSQSDLDYKILKHLTEISKSKNIHISHHPRKTEKWLCIVTEQLIKIRDAKGYKQNFIITLEPKTISLEFYSDAEFATEVFRKIDSFDIFNVYRKDNYSNRIYQKDIITEEDYFNKSYEELIRIYEEAFNEFMKEDVLFLYEEINRLV